MIQEFEFEVIGGELVPVDPKGWAMVLRGLDGRRVTMPKPRVRRETLSAKQRRYYRGVIIPHIASFCAAGDESYDYLHEVLLEKHAPRIEGPMGDVAMRTSKDDLAMNTVEAEEYFKAIREWAGEFWHDQDHHGWIPLPNEYVRAAISSSPVSQPKPEPSEGAAPRGKAGPRHSS